MVVTLCNSCGSGILMVVVLQQKGVREGGIGMLEATTSFWMYFHEKYQRWCCGRLLR